MHRLFAKFLRTETTSVRGNHDHGPTEGVVISHEANMMRVGPSVHLKRMFESKKQARSNQLEGEARLLAWRTDWLLLSDRSVTLLRFLMVGNPLLNYYTQGNLQEMIQQIHPQNKFWISCRC